MRSSASLAVLGLLGVTASWGSTFIIFKDAIRTFPVADFLAVRFTLAAAALFLIRPSAMRRLERREWRNAVVLGLLYGAGQLLQTFGLQFTSATVSGFVTGMYVVFTPLGAALLFRRRVGAIAWLAIALSTAGLAVITLRGFVLGFGETLTLVAAFIYALHILGLGEWSRPKNAYALSVVQMSVIAVVCLVAALPGRISLPSTSEAWLQLLYAALVAGALALVVQTWAQAHLSATRAAVIMTMEPVFAAAFAVWLGGEALGVRLMVGGAMVLVAMYVVELGPRRGADAEVTHIGPV